MALTGDQFTALYKAECSKIATLQLKHEGTLKFFAAACLEGDGIQADTYRSTLRSILDNILDCESQKSSLMQQLSKS